MVWVFWIPSKAGQSPDLPRPAPAQPPGMSNDRAKFAAKEINVILRDFDAFRERFLYGIANMINALKLVAVRTEEGEKLHYLRLACDRLIQRDILLTIGKLRR